MAILIMKKLLAALLLLLCSLSFAQGQPEADTFLYKISKKGRPDSYLLGTLHVGKIHATLPAAYRRALQQSGRLVVESDADALSPTQTAQMMALIRSTRPLSSVLGSARVQRLQQAAAEGQETIAFDADAPIKPWMLFLSLQSQFSPKGYSYRYGTDNLLIAAAKRQGKPVTALETLEPLYVFNALPEDAVVRALDSFVRHRRAFLQDETRLIADYRANRARALWAAVADPQHQLKYLPAQDRALWQTLMYDRLLTERNQRWLPKLIDILPHQPTLIAVGSAHLFGRQGLIARLRQVGYRVEPVRTANAP